MSSEESVTDAFAVIRPFFSIPPEKRWQSYIHCGEECPSASQLRAFAGRSTWEKFQQSVFQDHQTLGKSHKKYAHLLTETWSVIDQKKAPGGWSAVQKPDVYREDDDVVGIFDECMVVREGGINGQIVGFVDYWLAIRFHDFYAEKKKGHRPAFDGSLRVTIDLIYVLPSYRGKGFGASLGVGVFHRLTSLLKHLLVTRMDGRGVCLSSICVDGDCDSEEGCYWLGYLTSELKNWHECERRDGPHAAALKRTQVIGDYGF